MQRRFLLAGPLAAAVLALGGCAGFNGLSSTVASYSQWTAGRAPGTFVFDRLPSQEVRSDMRLVEDAARPALLRSGFRAATDGQAADYGVQLGVRVSGNERGFYNDPWFGGGYGRISSGYWGRGLGVGLGFGVPYTPIYEREVTLVVRDRRSGQPIYETRAVNDGASPSINSLLPAMFDAALADFPHASGPRRVVTPIER